MEYVTHHPELLEEELAALRHQSLTPTVTLTLALSPHPELFEEELAALGHSARTQRRRIVGADLCEYRS